MGQTGIGGAPEVLRAVVEDRGLGLDVAAEGWWAAVVEERELGLGVGGEGCAWAAVADVD